MEITDIGLWFLLLVVLAGAIGQLVDGALGMGFGVLTSTVMIVSGVNPVLAVATVNLAKMGSGLFSGLSHWSFGNVRLQWLFPLAISGILGGVMGALLLTQLPLHIARFWVPIILLTLGILLVRRFWSRNVDFRPIAGGSQELIAPLRENLWKGLTTTPQRLPSALRLSAAGYLAGVLNGMSGAYGPAATTSVMMLEGGHPRYAVGTVNLAEFFVTSAVFASLILHLDIKGFHWQLPLALVVGSLMTAPIAAYLTRHLPSRILGLAIGTTLIALNLWVALRAIF